MSQKKPPILNEVLKFSQLPKPDQDAFLGGALHKRFEANHLFYKMSRTPRLTSFEVTPWWSSYEPAIHGDGGFVGSWNHPLGIRNATRIDAAVPEHWNSLDNLVMMRLREPVYGFVGKCARQLAHPGKNPLTNGNFGAPYLGGGHVQVFMPNLTIKEIEWMMSSPV